MPKSKIPMSCESLATKNIAIAKVFNCAELNIFYSIYYMADAKTRQLNEFGLTRDNKKDLLLYYEARTRQVSDWLVGMNGSRLYTLLLQQKGFNESLSIGRVQSPTIYLIYQRQKEIENFVSTPFYEIEGNFTAKNGSYKGKAKIKSDKKEKVQQLLQQHNIMKQNGGCKINNEERKGY